MERRGIWLVILTERGIWLVILTERGIWLVILTERGIWLVILRERGIWLVILRNEESGFCCHSEERRIWLLLSFSKREILRSSE